MPQCPKVWKDFDRLDLLLPVIRRVRFWLLPAIVRVFGFAVTGRQTKRRVTHARKRGPRPWTQRDACVGSVYSIDRFFRSAEDVVNDVIRKQRAQDRPIPQTKYCVPN